MKTFHPKLAREFDERLAARESALCALLAAHEAQPRPPDHEGTVTDFKDLAGERSDALVDAADTERIAMELEQVLAARRRLQENTYGRCLECDEALDLRRLTAVPEAAFCAPCQALRETGDRAAGPTH